MGAVWVAEIEDRDGSLFATVADPDGNLVQIIQSDDPPRRDAEATRNAAMFDTVEAYRGFSVDDTGAARDLYRDTIGLSVSEEHGLLTLHLGTGRDVIVYPKPGHTPASFTILNFPDDDIERAVRELTWRGVELQRYEGVEQDEHGIARGDGPLIAWFTDPAGNILSVLEERGGGVEAAVTAEPLDVAACHSPLSRHDDADTAFPSDTVDPRRPLITEASEVTPGLGQASADRGPRSSHGRSTT
jgi:hypothetical protein